MLYAPPPLALEATASNTASRKAALRLQRRIKGFEVVFICASQHAIGGDRAADSGVIWKLRSQGHSVETETAEE